jgi:tRNA modification GTPase
MTTIFAPITSCFSSAVIVIRISGNKTLECLRSLGFAKDPEHQKIYYHKIFDPKNSELIDEALISFFKSPYSLTGEDVAEISIHGSPFILKKVFTILSAIENVRFAEAGEFLKTAFLNNKIDLVQAEAIPDLIAAETEAQHAQALRQLQGDLGKIYDNWREKLIEISARIEAFIDFPDDDLPQDLIDQIEMEVRNLSLEIIHHLDDKKLGQKIKTGLSLAIIGSPNVGKSSLINFLANSEIAIVSEIAGTTRDIVETNLSIAGVPVRIADTAGLRQTIDQIEQEGIRRALKKAKDADIKIFMFDAKNPILRDEDLELLDEKTIVVMNKIDLGNCDKIANAIKISINKNINTGELIKKLEEKVLEIMPAHNHPLITQERYRIILNAALVNLEEFSLQKNIELAAEDLRMACLEIGKITGKIDIENILDAIFSRFCIGK